VKLSLYLPAAATPTEPAWNLNLVRLSRYLQVFDVCLLVPALALLFLLIFTAPRCREKLSGSFLLVLALHLSTSRETVSLSAGV
jgi:hypothetical protein